HDLRHPLPFARRRPLSPTPHAILPPFARTDGPAGRLPPNHPPPPTAPPTRGACRAWLAGTAAETARRAVSPTTTHHLPHASPS
ncbi:MAG: hypothetical protein AAGI71_18245, partial [Bacteroidota bacterium]